MNVDIDQTRHDKVRTMIDDFVAGPGTGRVGRRADMAHPIIFDDDRLIRYRNFFQPVEQLAAFHKFAHVLPRALPVVVTAATR